MTIKTILAACTTPEAAQRILPAACGLARRFGAHLIGLHTIEALAVYPGIAMHLTGDQMSEFQKSQEIQAEKIKAIFDARTRSEDFVSEWRLVNARSMTAADRIMEHARSVDLVILSQEQPDIDRPDQRDVQERTIRDSGRPVLVIPTFGSFEEVGRSVMVGWSPTRESARAAHDAIPLMAADGQAFVLTAHHAKADNDLAQDTARELAMCYDRHGIRTTLIDATDDGLSIGDVLLNESFERGCDLIVTGAFGHSRAYDLLFGATTTHLLHHMTAPVLFSS